MDAIKYLDFDLMSKQYLAIILTVLLLTLAACTPPTRRIPPRATARTTIRWWLCLGWESKGL